MRRTTWAAILHGVSAGAIAVFGLIAFLRPLTLGTGAAGYVRADGLATLAFGATMLVVSVRAVCRGETWAWALAWSLPGSWLAHLVLHLPPSRDVWHQWILLLAGVAGQALGWPFPRRVDAS